MYNCKYIWLWLLASDYLDNAMCPESSGSYAALLSILIRRKDSVLRLRHSINIARLDTCWSPNPGFKTFYSSQNSLWIGGINHPLINDGFLAWGFPHYKVFPMVFPRFSKKLHGSSALEFSLPLEPLRHRTWAPAAQQFRHAPSAWPQPGSLEA